MARDGTAETDVRDRPAQGRHDRDREPPDRDDHRGVDARDVFMRDLNLPRGPERELVRDRDRDYTLNRSESRTLSTVGAFRVVSERDLRGSSAVVDLRHLEDQGLIQRVALNESERAIALTEHGRGLLERHRDGHSDRRQAFYAGADKARERTHDAKRHEHDVPGIAVSCRRAQHTGLSRRRVDVRTPQPRDSRKRTAPSSRQVGSTETVGYPVVGILRVSNRRGQNANHAMNDIVEAERPADD